MPKVLTIALKFACKNKKLSPLSGFEILWGDITTNVRMVVFPRMILQ